jgi:hypothetical protein
MLNRAGMPDDDLPAAFVFHAVAAVRHVFDIDFLSAILPSGKPAVGGDNPVRRVAVVLANGVKPFAFQSRNFAFDFFIGQ